jgi:surfactin family lipopeptide synthetase A
MQNGSHTPRIANRSAARHARCDLPLTANGHVCAEQVIPRRAERKPAPLSFAQQRLWAMSRLEPESSAGNEAMTLRLEGTLNIDALGNAINAIVERHEILKTTFAPAYGGDPVQLVGASQPVNLPIFDLSECAESLRDTYVERTIVAMKNRPFDLSRDLLLRATLLRLGPTDHVLLLLTHRIVFDASSSEIFCQELAMLYRAFSQGKPHPLPALPIQYADYATWQRDGLQVEVLHTHLAYWKHQLRQISVLQLPLDHPRLGFQNCPSGRQILVLPGELSDQLKVFSRRQGATLFMTLLAAFQALLHRYTGQDDIAVGSSLTGRSSAQTAGMIGCFVNTRAFRTDLSGNPTFQKLLTRVRETCLKAYEHEDLPLEQLAEELNAEGGRTPLCQVMFAVENRPRLTLAMPELVATSIEIHSLTSKCDLDVAFIDRDQQLALRMEYRSDLFDAATIARMTGHFQTLLERVVDQPDRPISELPLLTKTEKRQLLVEWNDTKIDFPQDRCVHELFESQANRSPDAVAVVFEGNQLTYRELNVSANRLAHYLRKLGVGREILVGLYMERCPEMIVALLAIHKAGGAYVPLDPNYPLQRLLVISDETKFPVLLSQQRLAESFPHHVAKVICLDTEWTTIARESEANLGGKATAENLAYVLYTSGSTGLPKGVEITHRALTNFVRWASTRYELAPNDRVLQFASISFDTAVEEIFPCLVSGAKLVLRTASMADSLSGFLQRCRDWKITVLDLPTVYWHELADEILSGRRPNLGNLRLLIIGGEQACAARLSRWREVIGAQVRLVNTYGPTEATVVSTIWESPGSSQPEESQRKVSIGRPISNAQVYILDAHLNPVPVGLRGELHIGGVGLARGYRKCPELTVKNFIAHPFCRTPGARLYKTGDFARYLPDGNIEFLGRIDDQVKIRGFRVELGEIEAVLRHHGSVRDTVVLPCDDGPDYQRLVAYVLPEQSALPTASELRGFLNATLPDYMVPSRFVLLDALPLMPNGKIDRHALPTLNRPELKDGFVAPRSADEKIMASIWAETLKLKQIGLYDNFFDLGRHSFLAMEVISRVRKVFAIDVPLRELFAAPTVAGMTAAVVHKRFQATARQNFGDFRSRLQSPPGETLPRILLKNWKH